MYGPGQLGFYVLGITIVGFAKILAEFGMQNPMVNYVARYQAERDVPRMRGTILLTLGVSFALSLALVILMFLGADFLADEVFNEPSLETPFRVFSITVPFFTLMSMALWATQGFQTVKYFSLVQLILQPFINLVLIVIFYLLGAQLLGAVAAYVISMAAGAALALYYLRRMFPQLLDRDTSPIFESRTVISDSKPVFVAVSSEYINLWTGVVVLGILATGEEVGIYNVAARTALVSGVVYLAFIQIFAPIISTLHGRGRMHDLSHLYKDVSRWIFTGGLMVFWVTVVLSKDILAVFGEEFVVGWVVMIIEAGGQLFALSIGATNHVLLMTGHQRTYMLAMVAAAVTGLLASFALVPIFGMLGAAFSDVGTTVLANTITLVAIRKTMNLWPYDRQYFKPVTAGFVAAIVTFFARSLLPLSYGVSALLILAPLFLVSFAVTLLGLGLSSSDRQLLKATWVAVRRAG
jgi:O-antigen/teichoic acid export membrane protein